MSSPEASIEEILASIRKTFTDEPESPGAAAAPGATESRSNGMPPFRSASEGSALGSTNLPLPTPPRSRVSAIDDDLDDLIDKPSSYSSSAPRPPETPPRAGPAPAGSVSPVEAAREKWANLLNPHPLTHGMTAKASEPKPEPAFQPAPPAPSPAAASAPAPTPPAPASPAPATSATSELFAPRKGGFYPPQETRADPLAAMSSIATDTGAAPTAPAVTAPAPPPRSSFIPFWQPAAAAATHEASSDEASASTAPADGVSKSPVADVPAATSRALDDLVAELNGAAVAGHEPFPASTTTLTASPSRQAVPIVELPKAGVPTSASAMTDARTLSAPTVSQASDSEAAATSPSSGSRSFEDVVADMLRPLLEKWIDENMPRIVERALQRDAALGRKPGQ